MPALAGQDQGGPLLRRERVGQVHALLKDTQLDGLPLPVERAQLLGKLRTPDAVGGEEELRGQAGAAHPARGVNTGGQRVPDGYRGEGLLIQPRLAEEGLQAGPLRVGQGAEPHADDGAVFPHHAHHVGHGAHGGQIGVLAQQGALGGWAGDGQRQLEGHPHPGQTLEGVGAVRTVGVHHRNGGREGGFALVVVGDDEVHPQRGGQVGLLHGGDAAVHGDDELHTLGVETLHSGGAQAVTLLHPVGDVGSDGRPQGAEVVGQQAGGGDAVHIVIAIDRDVLSAVYGGPDARHGSVHIPQKKRVV